VISLSKLHEYDVSEAEMNREGRRVLVSGSDAKLVAALRSDFDRQSCVDHDLSLAVKTAMKSAEATSIGYDN